MPLNAANPSYTERPKVTVSCGSVTLTEGVDYNVNYDNYSTVGTASVTITGLDDYIIWGSTTLTYQVTGTKLTSSMIRVNNSSRDYDPNGWTPSVGTDFVLSDGNTPLVMGTDYVLELRGDSTKVGSFQAVFTGIGKYTGSVIKTFTIKKRDVSDADVMLLASSWSYMAGGTTPLMTVTVDGYPLVRGRDFKVVCANNKAVTTSATAKLPSVYITGIGNYQGSTKAKPVTFKIKAGQLPGNVSYVNKTPDVMLKDKPGNFISALKIYDGSVLLKEGKDFEIVRYEDADGYTLDPQTRVTTEHIMQDAGYEVIYVRCKGIGNYSGYQTYTYSVYYRDLSKVTIQAIPAQAFEGGPLFPDITVTYKIGSIQLALDPRYYTVDYMNNEKPGTATVKITGRNGWGGTKTATFKIDKANLLK